MADRWWGKPSDYPWEQAALDHVRALMPDRHPYRGWQGFSFTSANGRIRECDLLLVAPTGVFLVEIKSHPGRATNQGRAWTFASQGRRRWTYDNPLYFVDQKAKEIKQRFQWAASKLSMHDVRVPFITGAVFLSADDLRCEFDENQREWVFGREGLENRTGLPGIWSGLVEQPSQQRPSPQFLKNVTRLMQEIGAQPLDRNLELGSYTLERRSFESGPTWTDFLAKHTELGSSARVRLYHHGKDATEEEALSVKRAARREYLSLDGVSHQGIVRAEDFGVIDGRGPGVVFRHRPAWQRLDHYMAESGADLEIDTRLEMVRQLAEAVNHAHRNRLSHRALAARSVWVELDGEYPRLRIADWQVAASENMRAATATGQATLLPSTHTLEQALGSRVLADHVEAAAQAYLAPEFPEIGGDARALDIFGLGALAYLIFTGQPPGRDRSALSEHIREHGALTPSTVSDSVAPPVDTLVRDATHRSPGDRLPNVHTFLRRLDDVEEYLTRPEVVTDPLVAGKGDEIQQGITVESVLGTGATSRALLVKDRAGKRRMVYKVAVDSDRAPAILEREAETIARVAGSQRIVSLAGDEGIQQIGDRTVLVLERAGEQTLADYLTKDGALGRGELLRFGQHLFDALEHLEEKGVFHRDIKPANIGVRETNKKAQALILFDFSLSSAPVENTTAGTRGYLDPFLPKNADGRTYDEDAERYALAVTLHEMATGELPVWDDDGVDPDFYPSDLEEPRLLENAFPEQYRAALTAFFRKALKRDPKGRFPSLQQMREAWERAYHNVGAQDAVIEDDEETRRRSAETATLDTPLHLAGLTALALDMARRVLGCETVGDLLQVPVMAIRRLRGTTYGVRNELASLTAEWRKRLDAAEHAVAVRAKLPSGADERAKRDASLDQVILQFVPKTTDKNKDWVRVLRELIGLPEGSGARENWWPTHTEVASALGLTHVTVSEALAKAGAHWTKHASLLVPVRDDVVQILGRHGRVRDVRQIAQELLTMRGSTVDNPVQRLAYALAAVRVAVESEESRVGDPRFVVWRTMGVPIAAQIVDDPSAPVEADLFDYADQLGAVADGLVELDENAPLPTPAEVEKSLRGVPAPEGMDRLASSDIVILAASASKQARTTPRLELYPAALGLERALQITQAIGYLGDPGVTPQQLRDRVLARFPELARPTDRQLHECLKKRHPKLCSRIEDGTEYWYLEREYTSLAPSTVSGHRFGEGVSVEEAQAWARLEHALPRGGYLALKTWLPDTERVAAAIADRGGAVPFDVTAEFVATFDALIEERGGKPSWDMVLQADKDRPAPFEKMLDDVFARLGERIRAAGADKPVFAYRATPLARYAQGRSLLAALAGQARDANERPFGLWLLCPMRGPQAPPTLDESPAGIIADGEQLLLPRGFGAAEPVAA
ncbi:BREX system serine/threonine kinase PglW [Nocardiopsis suaedae]|uniref:non-specific serine/threonine protein kinase n=1 Tax=Nocardiopsis suaedae TaxID=3018444 RepID=A0ABT4TR77_9ACTN|nr:BREX system serine/threonine kinase PglW [Nocardiopsis suaedae]MDA2806637.1 BREX system serine/threonine kinase PglW [Nocardiopsis suaedae]